MTPSTTHHVETDIPPVSFRSATHPTRQHVTPSCRRLVTGESQVPPEQGTQLLHSHFSLLRQALRIVALRSLIHGDVGGERTCCRSTETRRQSPVEDPQPGHCEADDHVAAASRWGWLFTTLRPWWDRRHRNKDDVDTGTHHRTTHHIVMCVCVCMHACMHACMYVCMHVCHVEVDLGLSLSVRVPTRLLAGS